MVHEPSPRQPAEPATGRRRDPATDAPPTLAQRIDQLFRTVHPPGRPGQEYTPEEVAAAITTRAHGDDDLKPISDTYLRYLRRGERTNPSIKHLRGLAEFFGVPLTYLVDDDAAERIHSQLAFLAAIRDSGVRLVALRAAGLSPQSLQAIATIIDQVSSLEGLPTTPPPMSAHWDAADQVV